MVQNDLANLPSLPRTFRYPGIPPHVMGWSWAILDIALVCIYKVVAGSKAHPSARKPLPYLLLIVVLSAIGLAGLLEWLFRNRAIKMTLDNNGVDAVLSWGRRRRMAWHDVREVRATNRPLRGGKSIWIWEIRNSGGEKQIDFNSEIPGYSELLQLLRANATSCHHFDEEK